MNDFEIDKILENINVTIPPSLESNIFSSSSKALKRSHFLRTTIRRTLLTAAVLLIGTSTFMAGQFHQKHKKNTSQVYVNAGDQDTLTITVPKEFLAWIDAGKFFNQIEMKDKATEAFDKAISLIPETDLDAMTHDNQAKETFLCNSMANEGSKIIATMTMMKPASN